MPDVFLVSSGGTDKNVSFRDRNNAQSVNEYTRSNYYNEWIAGHDFHGTGAYSTQNTFPVYLLAASELCRCSFWLPPHWIQGYPKIHVLWATTGTSTTVITLTVAGYRCQDGAGPTEITMSPSGMTLTPPGVGGRTIISTSTGTSFLRDDDIAFGISLTRGADANPSGLRLFGVRLEYQARNRQ